MLLACLHNPALALRLQSYGAKGALYMHVHVPKTGGTTLSNMLMAAICNKGETPIGGLVNPPCHHDDACVHGLVDCRANCMGGERPEHPNDMNQSRSRAESLKVSSGAESIRYVTTIRSGTARLFSHYAHNLIYGPISNASLLKYMSNEYGEVNPCGGRADLQVATFASVPGGHRPTRDDLEKAKRVLSNEDFVVGVTECMPALYARLLKLGGSTAGQLPIPRVNAEATKNQA